MLLEMTSKESDLADVVSEQQGEEQETDDTRHACNCVGVTRDPVGLTRASYRRAGAAQSASDVSN